MEKRRRWERKKGKEGVDEEEEKGKRRKRFSSD